ncbi:uncharacterized protein BDR25DRAFT_301214 [Lindgomyces ingoldianus]|uniref:Uncharacterized protein n=1 Tax=Lindgomyces ingoldianus TaxID=673940 RepID=A0ACB6R5B1_9PLEO|nr:uncharacterized protein BDR25DRAFT_301214 [Lindgomyces ingoldianus]KAF2474499.1 hypothetical protein BDR25DRAFT_301214 [Lindgomyces ingoldianus]
MADSDLAMKSIPNFRDVGSFINETTGERLLKTGLLFRGARPDEASPQDKQRLVNDYAIKTIIDLRTDTEHAEQAQKRAARENASASPSKSEMKVLGIEYLEINFNGQAFKRMLIRQLPWSRFVRLASLHMFGYRLEAIKVIAPIMEAQGLVGLALNSLDVCTAEVKQVFDVLSDSQQYPLMVHCTQGKDRTGLIIILVLLLLRDISIRAITIDYLLSERELEPEKGERIKEIASIGLSAHFTTCPPNLVAEVDEHLSKNYGSVEGYLDHAGVLKEQRDRIMNILVSRQKPRFF